MAKKNQVKNNSLKSLNAFIRKNKKADLETVNLLDEKTVSAFNWKGLEEEKEKIIQQAKAYQRLLRIVPEGDPKLIKALLEENIHSAIQIASISRQQFSKQYLALFGNDKQLLERTYENAVARRNQTLIRYMNQLQNNEAHISAANFQ